MVGSPVATGFLFVGGRLCVDFVNTEVVVRGRRQDLLESDAHVLEWASLAGVRLPEGGGGRSSRTRRSAVVSDTRAAVRSILDRQLHGRPPTRASLTSINRILARGVASGTLSWGGDRWSF